MRFKRQAFAFAWGLIWRLNGAGLLFVILGWAFGSRGYHLIAPLFLILNAIGLIVSANIIWRSRHGTELTNESDLGDSSKSR
jgi:hypothetical protein